MTEYNSLKYQKLKHESAHWAGKQHHPLPERTMHIEFCYILQNHWPLDDLIVKFTLWVKWGIF